MLVLAKRNIILHNADRSEWLMLQKDGFTFVPDRFTATEYFAALVKDGKIVVPATRKDKDVETANEAAEAKLSDKLAEQQTETPVLPDSETEEKPAKRGRKPKK